MHTQLSLTITEYNTQICILEEDGAAKDAQIRMLEEQLQELQLAQAHVVLPVGVLLMY